MDALVVGAGPGGATAARTLASLGLRVQVLERATFPRNKPCGGGISVRALARFPWLGPALRRIPTHFVSRLQLEGPGGTSALVESASPAVVLVRRIEFDQLLAGVAVESGAEIHEGAWVSEVSADEEGVSATTRDGRCFRARYLVAADGVNGIVTRRLGMHPGWDGDSVALDMMEEAPDESLRACDPGTLWVAYGYGGADGYGYIFPKRGHVNVGVGCLLSHYRAHLGNPPYDVQRDFVASLEARGLIVGKSRRDLFTPSHIPVAGPIPETAKGRVLVVGDAGGFVNAYTAEGIYYAMVSGDLAARAIADAERADRPGPHDRAARRYVRAWRREVGAELGDSVLVQKYLFRESARIAGVVSGAAEYEAVAKTIVDYAKGILPYSSARATVLRRFPRLLGALARLAFQAGRGRQAPGHGLQAEPPTSRWHA